VKPARMKGKTVSDLTYYRALDLKPGASLDEVKSAYRKLVKEYHPDSAGVRSNSAKFASVVNAYKSLLKTGQAGNTRDKATERTASPRQQGADASQKILFRMGKTLLSSPSPGARKMAAQFLGKSGKRYAYAFLRKALWDEDQAVQSSVVKAIGQLKVRQSAYDFGALFLKAKPSVKTAILEAIRRIGPTGEFRSVVKFARVDGDPAVRQAAMTL
jgi:HEAT repeat protein